VEAAGEEPLRAHVETYEDAEALRGQLADRHLVAFVADGAGLPRRSGVDDRPLARERAVPFESPVSLRITLNAPHAGEVTGMGVPEGVTLLVGGGFHGKSTLLRALERGVYNHIPGDGRERVVTLGDAVKVRAEDGRQVTGTDISNFIGDLPGGEDTRRFHTENASGSTSQAAAIAEALEVGTRCLLLDEDTSATNFLIRDARVQALIAKEHEPITPFIDRARALHREHGVSVVLVIGGAGDYFDVADTVIALRGYQPHEVTEEAREIAQRLPSERRPEGVPWSAPAARVPEAGSVSARRGRREVHIKVFGEDRMAFGEEEMDLSAIEQLVERGQVAAIGRALVRAASREMGEGKAATGGGTGGRGRGDAQGLDLLDERIVGDYAEFRAHEMAAVLNRLRTLRTSPPDLRSVLHQLGLRPPPAPGRRPGRASCGSARCRGSTSCAAAPDRRLPRRGSRCRSRSRRPGPAPSVGVAPRILAQGTLEEAVHPQGGVAGTQAPRDHLPAVISPEHPVDDHRGDVLLGEEEVGCLGDCVPVPPAHVPHPRHREATPDGAVGEGHLDHVHRPLRALHAEHPLEQGGVHEGVQEGGGRVLLGTRPDEAVGLAVEPVHERGGQLHVGPVPRVEREQLSRLQVLGHEGGRRAHRAHVHEGGLGILLPLVVVDDDQGLDPAWESRWERRVVPPWVST
jgi:predicted ABC-class ATPase